MTDILFWFGTDIIPVCLIMYIVMTQVYRVILYSCVILQTTTALRNLLENLSGMFGQPSLQTCSGSRELGPTGVYQNVNQQQKPSLHQSSDQRRPFTVCKAVDRQGVHQSFDQQGPSNVSQNVDQLG